MDKRQVANWNRHLKVKKAYEDNGGPTTPALMQRVWARYEALLATTDDLMTSPAGRTQGATLKKSEEEKRAIAAALPLANALYLLYLEDEDDEKASEKAHALRRNKSAYSSLLSALTLAETRNVVKQAQALKSKLESEAGLDAADLKELDKANHAFSEMLVAPQTARAGGKTTTTNLGNAVKAADKFLDTDLKPATKTLKTKFPKLYAALLEAMRIDDAPSPQKSPDQAQKPAPTT